METKMKTKARPSISKIAKECGMPGGKRFWNNKRHLGNLLLVQLGCRPACFLQYGIRPDGVKLT